MPPRRARRPKTPPLPDPDEPSIKFSLGGISTAKGGCSRTTRRRLQERSDVHRRRHRTSTDAAIAGTDEVDARFSPVATANTPRTRAQPHSETRVRALRTPLQDAAGGRHERHEARPPHAPDLAAEGPDRAAAARIQAHQPRSGQPAAAHRRHAPRAAAPHLHHRTTVPQHRRHLPRTGPAQPRPTQIGPDPKPRRHPRAEAAPAPPRAGRASTLAGAPPPRAGTSGRHQARTSPLHAPRAKPRPPLADRGARPQIRTEQAARQPGSLAPTTPAGLPRLPRTAAPPARPGGLPPRHHVRRWCTRHGQRRPRRHRRYQGFPQQHTPVAARGGGEGRGGGGGRN
jgi:hypothetical protein